MKKLIIVLGLLLIALAISAEELPARALQFTYEPNGVMADLSDGAIGNYALTITNTDPNSLLFNLKSSSNWIEILPNDFVLVPGRVQVVNIKVIARPNDKLGTITMTASSATSSTIETRQLPVKVEVIQNKFEVDRTIYIGAIVLFVIVFVSLATNPKRRR